MTPDKPEHTYTVQVLAAIEVNAANKRAARRAALAELARLCESGAELVVRVEEIKR